MSSGNPSPATNRCRVVLHAAALAVVGMLGDSGSALRAEVVIHPEEADVDIFDPGMFADGEVEVVNGRLIIKPNAPKKEEKPEPDPAGEQVLELTDGSQLHGKLIALTRDSVVWQRADATDELLFTPQEIRRLLLSKNPPSKDNPANATLKLHGSDWIAGDLTELKDDRFLVRIGSEEPLGIPRGKVEWLSLLPANPPDAFDGPIGPMGLAGWEMANDNGAAWDYADGSLIAKAASAITRQFDVLPELLDLQFTAGDGGSSNRGLTLWIQPGNRTRGYGKGSMYLRFQSNTVNANCSLGDQMKTFSANLPAEKEEKKLTRYRLLVDRKEGRLIVLVNGKQVADWDLPAATEISPNGSLIWQPSYWSSNMAWTLSNVRVQPWDGTTELELTEAETGKDLLSIAGQPRKSGAIEQISQETVTFGGVEVSRKDRMFIRIAGEDGVEPPPTAIARVWLTQRGEFDVTAIGFRDGVLKVRTSFAGDLALSTGAVRAIEFPHKLAAADKPIADGGDMLIFRNGDQLRGTMLAASHDAPLRWKPVKGEKPVEFTTDRISGIILAARPGATAKGDSKEVVPTSAIRFHNGDWLPGTLQGIDGETFRLNSPIGADLRLRRASVKSLYLSNAGESPVWDGASDRELWIKGAGAPGYWGDNSSRTRKDDKRPGPWRYLDGAYTLISSGNSRNYNSGPNLGRTLQSLPDLVEVSFLLSTSNGPASYSVQLFSDENKPGFMVQGGWDSAYLYDMSPRRNGGVFFNQPQQLEFGDKVGSEGNHRHFRFFGDRKSGRLWMYVNGHLVGSLSKRTPGADNPKGKSISIVPQPMISRVTISNLWVAPWSGTLPPSPKGSPAPVSADASAEAKTPAAQATVAKDASDPTSVPTRDTIALTNGDETIGKVLKADGSTLTLQCDVGELAIPLERAALVDFDPIESVPTQGAIRLRFTGRGALTVETLRIEGDRVICRSATTGELSFPLAQVAEIIYRPVGIPSFPTPVKKADDGGAQENPQPRNAVPPPQIIIQ